MSELNSTVLLQAASMTNPISFTTTTGAASANAAMVIVRANIDTLVTVLSRESSNEDQNRLFLDQMTPAARTSMIAILLGLKTASPNP